MLLPRQFREFTKIARLNRECVITEKIDGTNAQVFIERKDLLPFDDCDMKYFLAESDGLVLMAGSRSQFIAPDKDNHGFAAWVQQHRDDLWALGPGRHYGEWWGGGVQRGYGFMKGEKFFSLFNTSRWTPENVPACCRVVPVLYRGLFTTQAVTDAEEYLRVNGSVASPGFTRPEGVIVFHTHANMFFKVTLQKDELPKSLVKESHHG
jgi:hypothetical protein